MLSSFKIPQTALKIHTCGRTIVTMLEIAVKSKNLNKELNVWIECVIYYLLRRTLLLKARMNQRTLFPINTFTCNISGIEMMYKVPQHIVCFVMHSCWKRYILQCTSILTNSTNSREENIHIIYILSQYYAFKAMILSLCQLNLFQTITIHFTFPVFIRNNMR